METYSNQEKADTPFMYGLANRNDLEAERLYRQRFPRRHVPDRKKFERLHRYLCETGSFVTGISCAHSTGSVMVSGTGAQGGVLSPACMIQGVAGVCGCHKL
ncbi:hypothetical protein AVEN_121966-1 [Araneus ventricosus]|uniref:DUF4817 domain-containing protein n=1 Tax=Araneus ventricosus TaxID=182803 RepID=A0A4Y2MGW2_ARAVE|nr:hypothetical protein AVEN_275698-1 [Araneus ventricosus]GBN25704.1 hypothetical protein AVEN_121966-1 [Araneus ventricosus]